MAGKACNVVELQGTVGSARRSTARRASKKSSRPDASIKIVRSQTGDFTRAKGKEVMEAFLKAEGGGKTICALYAHNDDMAIGAIQAIEGSRPEAGQGHPDRLDRRGAGHLQGDGRRRGQRHRRADAEHGRPGAGRHHGLQGEGTVPPKWIQTESKLTRPPTIRRRSTTARRASATDRLAHAAGLKQPRPAQILLDEPSRAANMPGVRVDANVGGSDAGMKQSDCSALLRCAGSARASGTLRALHDVDFALRAGEIHALLGENGAGKSTLIKVLTGVYPRDAGDVRLDGAAGRAALGQGRGADAGISTVYQEVNLLPNLSVAENLYLGRQPTRFGLVRDGRDAPCATRAARASSASHRRRRAARQLFGRGAADGRDRARRRPVGARC